MNGHTYYCYLDIYLDTGKGIKIFEAKATTTNKFYKLGKSLERQMGKAAFDNALGYDKYDSIFYKDEQGILRLKETLDKTLLEDKTYLSHRNKMF